MDPRIVVAPVLEAMRVPVSKVMARRAAGIL
jgi:hypothetical protein